MCRVSRKVGLLKRRVRRSVLRGEIKNCTPLWRKAHLQVKMYKTRQLRTTFWSSDVEKLHAAVAKSRFWSENAKKLTVFGALLEVLMSKNCTLLWWKADFQVKFSKHVSFEALFALHHSKKCTRLWRKAHLEVKRLKNCSLRSTFGRSAVEKLYAAVAKSAFGSQNVKL